MIISKSDVTRSKRFLKEYRQWRESGGWASDFAPMDYFWENPHLLMPLGFDDYYGLDIDTAYDYAQSLEKPIAVPIDDADEFSKHIQKKFGLSELSLDFGVESLFRDLKSGAWFWLEGITDENSLHFVGPRAEGHRYLDVDDWISRLEKASHYPSVGEHRLWIPRLFNPAIQIEQDKALAAAVLPVMNAIQAEKTSLREVSWRTLEEIVAELLRAKGLQIHITPNTRDGGRDIIARGELIPGEPTVLAVEVKQKPTVGLADVQRFLKANEEFPYMMVATSGVFSSGVFAEKSKASNQLRLFLKDGLALSQWMDAYMKH